MTDERDLRPDHEMEGRVSSWLTATDLSPDEADAGLDRLLEEFPVTPQARRRFLGRWFERDEGAGRRTVEHDHAPNANRRNRLMLSATGITAALAILALSVSVIDTDPVTPGAVAANHVVAADGSGDFATIQAAVDVAAHGDTISILPGIYTEAVVVESDIDLLGDGPADEIVLVAPVDGPTAQVGEGTSAQASYALRLVEANGTVSGLTLREPRSMVHVFGGSPTISGLVLEDVGRGARDQSDRTGNAVTVSAGSTATISQSTLTGGGGIGVLDMSEPRVLSNALHQSRIEGGFGDDAVIRGNTIEATTPRAITIWDGGSFAIEDNTIVDPGSEGVRVNWGSPRIADNDISGATIAGISVMPDVSASIEGNRLTENRTAVMWNGADGLIGSNTITDGSAGLVIGDGSPTVEGNTIEGNSGRGLVIMASASPKVSGNTVCGNGTNLFTQGNASEFVDDSNEICEDAAPSE